MTAARELQGQEFAQISARGSDVTVVVFTGLGRKVGQIPPFEFSRTLDSLGVNSILLRDPNRSWYQTPVPKFGRTFLDKAYRIAEMIERCGGREVHFLGTSAGGFAALNYATLLPVESVLTLGAQTAISPERRKAWGDGRWASLIGRANAAAGGLFVDVTDAAPLKSRRGAIALVGTGQSLDLVHALHAVRHFGSAVEPIAVAGASHVVAPELKADGKLFPLLEAQFVNGGITWDVLRKMNALGGEHEFVRL